MFCPLSRLSCPASPSSFTSPTNHPWIYAGHCVPFAQSGSLRLPSSGQAPVLEAPQGAQVTRRPLKRAPGALLSGDRRLSQRFEAAGSSSIPALGEVVQLPSLSSLPASPSHADEILHAISSSRRPLTRHLDGCSMTFRPPPSLLPSRPPLDPKSQTRAPVGQLRLLRHPPSPYDEPTTYIYRRRQLRVPLVLL